jgi:Fe(3+) dicitrate transport protein
MPRTLGLFLLITFAATSASAQEASPDPAPQPPAPEGTEPDPVPVAIPESEPVPEPVPVPASGAPPIDVTVAGTRVARTAGSAHVIGEKRLDVFKYDDPTAILNQVPGVYSRTEDGMGLRPNIGLRGVNPNRSQKVTLMEDGILFGPAPYAAPAAYFFPQMARMTTVRVIKGPGAISYGPQTVGGAIDFITRPVPEGPPTGGVDLATGQYGYGKLHGWVGSGNEKIGFLVEGLHLRNDGWKELKTPTDDHADTGFIHNEWMVKGRYVFDPSSSMRNEVVLKLVYSDEISNESYLGLSDSDFRQNPLMRYPASALDRMQWHHTTIALTHKLEPLRDLAIDTTVYRHDFSRTWRKVNHFRGADIFDVLSNPGTPRNAVYAAVLRGQDSSSPDESIFVGPNQREFASQGIDSKIRYSPKTGPLSHKIEYGVRLHQDRIERKHSEDAFRMVGGQLVPEGAPTVVTAYNEASAEALALHAVDAVTWKDLTVTPGVRVEAIRTSFIDKAANTTSRALTQVVLPGIGGFYSLFPSLGVLAGVYRGFSPPVPEAAATSGPELSVNYEGGARFVHKKARLEVIGFYNSYSNLTDICTLSSGCVDQNLDKQFNAGKARIYGLEAFAQHEIPVVHGVGIPVTLSYTATRAQFLTDFSSDDPIFGNVKAGDEIPYVPRHQLNASVGVDSKRVSGAVAMNYITAMREVAGSAPLSESLSTDHQLVFDVSASFRVLEYLSLYGNVRNLFDEHYLVSRRPFGARPNPPRWIQVGLKATF